MRPFAAFALGFVIGSSGFAAGDSDPIAEGIATWDRRNEQRIGALAATEPISQAVTSFERALEENPQDLVALTWLLKALWFQGEYTSLSGDEKLAVFERGRDLAQMGIERLAAAGTGDARSPSEADLRRLRDVEHAADLYFWSAAHWGLWGRQRGKIASARQGVAGKIRDYAEITIALDETIENAGGHRVLGRLHTEAPRLPFVTGWVDRAKAVQECERAAAIAPDEWMNRLYLYEALIEFEPTRRAEALEGLRLLVAETPRPETAVKDAKILQDARELLQRAGE